MHSVRTMGYTVFSDDMNEIEIRSGSPRVLSTISPNSYGIATKDPLFKQSLQNADFLMLDGVYFALASILLQKVNIKRNQGPDVFYHFMKRINEIKGKVFFLGSTETTLQMICRKASVDYPDISVGHFSPPYKTEFDDADNNAMIEAVNSFSPDILFIGMTCPKQEKWAYQHYKKIDASLICCIGAVFDWYAGNYKEIGQIWWKLKLGWMVRAIQRPEVIKRNVPNYWIFAKDLMLTMLKRPFKMRAVE